MTIEKKENEEEFRKYKQEFKESDEKLSERKDAYDFETNDNGNFDQHRRKEIQYDQIELNADFFEKPISNKPSLAMLAERHLPITVPCDQNNFIRPGTLFHSKLYKTKDQWSKDSCFIQIGDKEGNQDENASLRDNFNIIYLPIDGGTSGSFKSTKTEGSIVKENHETYGFVATVDLGWIKASAGLEYDKNLARNNDELKVSLRASYRCGSILIRQTPSLTPDAARILKYEDGIEQFERKYGDYYVSGYNLGADNSILVSTDSSLVTEKEKKTVSASADSFLFDVHWSKTWDSQSSIGSARLSSIGYDSLEGKFINESTTWGDANVQHFKEVQKKTQEMISLAYALPSRVEAEAKKQGLLIGLESLRQNVRLDRIDNADPFEQEISSEVYERLIRSNLAVEMVLMPIKTLRDVKYWAMEDDVI